VKEMLSRGDRFLRIEPARAATPASFICSHPYNNP
jgi:hypothetical protein